MAENERVEREGIGDFYFEGEYDDDNNASDGMTFEEWNEACSKSNPLDRWASENSE